MIDDGDEADQGLGEARTRAAPENSAAALPPRSEIDQAVAALGAQLAADDAGQLDLLAGSPDLHPLDALERAAETTAAERRARGRPKGAANRRNTAVFEYLEALGHRDPAVTLSALQSADTLALAQHLGVDTPKGRLELLKIQRAAAAELMPYKYAKKPTAITVDKRELHLFVAGDLGGHAEIGDGTLFGGGQMQEIQGVSEPSTVRQPGDVSHDDS